MIQGEFYIIWYQACLEYSLEIIIVGNVTSVLPEKNP